MPELERRFVKGDVVRIVHVETAPFGGDTGTVVEHIYNDPYHYWVRVSDDFADIVPFRDDELEKADA